ncbi:hypothetical protein BpHYR1_001161 [Brachionus plicatilis]|uniref:Uncharacterized protein n=1 Tax=Brachionus plicatilis TaxID=10195 RepID=A0A3M7RKC5_BRAPC|nr:hypothetical protein BpHYR1_001161 [Brachionus plicatilis]
MPVSILGVTHRPQFLVMSLSCVRGRCSRSTTKGIPWSNPSLDNWIFQASALNDLTAETKQDRSKLNRSFIQRENRKKAAFFKNFYLSSIQKHKTKKKISEKKSQRKYKKGKSYTINKKKSTTLNLFLEISHCISFQGLPELLLLETELVSSYRFSVEETHLGDTPNNLAISFCFLFPIFSRPTICHFYGLNTFFYPNNQFSSKTINNRVYKRPELKIFLMSKNLSPKIFAIIFCNNLLSLLTLSIECSIKIQTPPGFNTRYTWFITFK